MFPKFENVVVCYCLTLPFLKQEGMLVAIKSLPSSAVVNIAGFGTVVKPLYTSSKPCADVSVHFFHLIIIKDDKY